ncbi:Serine/threonine protein kinase [Handroanthus impetiginosus]|uniref:Serine/threonine protein kinase n=1 Tax=Handroanthus impetiginosus TaxID=429701 RepID=A0A2G9GRG8_9LAMI|nr:Serine/threonine protein kinase [Handroanthus impetiginosus]
MAPMKIPPAGSFLSPTSPEESWLSPSGRFALGFSQHGHRFAVGRCSNRWFASGVYGPTQNTLVWVATIANIPTAASAVSMLDSGHSVLLDNKSTVIWDSFDHPTDKIWGGQRLIANSKLASGASPLYHSSGRFYMTMQSDENLVVYRVSFLAYLASESDTFAYPASKGRSDTFPYLDPETELLSLHYSNATFRFLTLRSSQTPGNKTMVAYRARFGPDGNFLAVMSSIPNLKNSITVLLKSVSPGNPIVSSKPKIVVDTKKALSFYREFTLPFFNYDELEKATNGFKEILGRNAYGAAYKGNLSETYKGNLSESNKSTAMKTLKNDEEGESKFRAEITAVGRTHHRNLVWLLGFCIEGPRKLLVYEFMNKDSFSNYLFRADNEPPWKERVRIALDVAREILCLHKECKFCIIHLKLLMTNQSGMFTGAKGSSGCMAPEWEKGVLLTEKADVHSRGAVMLEIIHLKIVVGDEEVDMKVLERTVKVRWLCLQDDANQWPPMKDVNLMLEGTVNIPEPRPLVAC